jgi:hypothetical protein
VSYLILMFHQLVDVSRKLNSPRYRSTPALLFFKRPSYALQAERLDGVGSQHHAPSAFSQVNSPDYHYTQGWLGPRAGLDRCGQQKISCSTEFRIRNCPALRYPRLHSYFVIKKYNLKKDKNFRKLYYLPAVLISS